eukprot:g5596.t1
MSVGASTSFPRPKEDPRAEILRLERRIAADVQAAFIDNSNTTWHVYLDLFERLRECLELSVKAEDAALQEKSGERGRLLEEIEHERRRGAIVERVSQMEKKYGDEVKLLEQARFQEMQRLWLERQH